MEHLPLSSPVLSCGHLLFTSIMSTCEYSGIAYFVCLVLNPWSVDERRTGQWY